MRQIIYNVYEKAINSKLRQKANSLDDKDN